MEKKILKKIFISAKLKTLTGLHIGGSGAGINIGAIENTVIRDSITNEPYIPGSSLKGKLRSLLEKLRGEYEIDEDGKAGPSKDQAHLSAKIFGISADENATNTEDNDLASIASNNTTDENATNTEDNPEDNTNKKDCFIRASRLIVRDAFLEEASKTNLEALNLDLPFTEVKTETSIDRVTSKANPRSIERVPKNTIFNVDMILTIYEMDDENELMKGLFIAMILLQEDYLGGHGSRGSGKIEFTIDSIMEKTNENYLSDNKKNNSSIEIPDELNNQTKDSTKK